MKKEYQLCNRCVMDNASDSTITFDKNGFCNYCSDAINSMGKIYFPNEIGEQKLDDLITLLKEEGKRKDYDCIMGISGGLDSSYLAYLGYKWGLRILAVHIDDGFDTEITKRNIEKLVKATNIDLIIEKPDSIQFNGLTRAFFMAGVPNLAIPQDNLIFASLYKYARKYKLRYFLSGGNFALESILQNGNTFTPYDMIHIKAINKLFGKTRIDKLKMISEYRLLFERRLKIIHSLRPLNYIDYNRKRALQELADFCDFEYYGGKHLENLLTKFTQNYWFYNKFKVDKRRSHLSSLIVSKQISRSEALFELKKLLYDKHEMDQDVIYICKALNISKFDFERVMQNENYQHTNYPTSNFESVKKHIRKVLNLF